MFEIILNAAQLLLSKDARDGFSAIYDAVAKSPEWTKDVWNVNVKFTAQEQERFQLLMDVIDRKMVSLRFEGEPRSAIRAIAKELIANVLQHTVPSNDARIDISIELSPAYISLLIRNSKGTPVMLKRWLELGSSSMRTERESFSGRGLQLVAHYSDVLAQVDEYTVKSVVYRNRVVVMHDVIHGVGVFVVLRGFENPTLVRRLVDAVRRSKKDKFIICLDSREYWELKAATDLTVPLVKPVEAAEGEQRFTQTGAKRIDDYGIHRYSSNQIAEIRKRLAKHTFVFVIADPIYLDLLPQGLAYSTLEDAIRAFGRN